MGGNLTHCGLRIADCGLAPDGCRLAGMDRVVTRLAAGSVACLAIPQSAIRNPQLSLP